MLQRWKCQMVIKPKGEKVTNEKSSTIIMDQLYQINHNWLWYYACFPFKHCSSNSYNYVCTFDHPLCIWFVFIFSICISISKYKYQCFNHKISDISRYMSRYLNMSKHTRNPEYKLSRAKWFHFSWVWILP